MSRSSRNSPERKAVPVPFLKQIWWMEWNISHPWDFAVMYTLLQNTEMLMGIH